MTAAEIIFSSWWTAGISLLSMSSTLIGVAVYRASGKMRDAIWCGLSFYVGALIASLVVVSFWGWPIDTDAAAQIMIVVATAELVWLWRRKQSAAGAV